MTATQMLQSMNGLQKLTNLKMPINKAYAIYNLIKIVNEKREFIVQEERKLVDKYNATIHADGKAYFNSIENQQSFFSEHAELLNYNFEEILPIELSMKLLEDEQFTPAEIAQMEGVILWVE